MELSENFGYKELIVSDMTDSAPESNIPLSGDARVQPRPQTVLREATTPPDIEQVRSLFTEYAVSLGFSLCFQSFDQELRDLPGAYARPTGRLFLARDGEVAAGCIAMRKLEVNVCEMKRLYVPPSHRGRGLGKMLVEHLIAEARAAGYQRMRLDTIQAVMKDAVALYHRVGFREIEPYSKVPIESALWMELLL